MSSVIITAPVQRAVSQIPKKSLYRPKMFFTLIALSVEAGVTLGLVLQSLTS